MKPSLLALFLSIILVSAGMATETPKLYSTEIIDKTKSLFKEPAKKVSLYATYLPPPPQAANNPEASTPDLGEVLQNPGQVFTNINDLFMNSLTSQLGIGVKVEF